MDDHDQKNKYKYAKYFPIKVNLSNYLIIFKSNVEDYILTFDNMQNKSNMTIIFKLNQTNYIFVSSSDYLKSFFRFSLANIDEFKIKNSKDDKSHFSLYIGEEENVIDMNDYFKFLNFSLYNKHLEEEHSTYGSIFYNLIKNLDNISYSIPDENNLSIINDKDNPFKNISNNSYINQDVFQNKESNVSSTVIQKTFNYFYEV